MDPLSALLLAMLIAGHFTRNITQDLVYKARGEDPPSFRREQQRLARDSYRRPLTEGRGARSLVRNAWLDAWETAEERRERAADKRAERRREQWERQDEQARERRDAEDQAHQRNAEIDAQTDPAAPAAPAAPAVDDDRPDAARTERCERCLTAVPEASLIARAVPGVGLRMVCPACSDLVDQARSAEKNSSDSPADQTPEEEAQEEAQAPPFVPAPGTSELCPHCIAQWHTDPMTGRARIVHELHCPRTLPAERAPDDANDNPPEEPDQQVDANTAEDREEDTDHDPDHVTYQVAAPPAAPGGDEHVAPIIQLHPSMYTVSAPPVPTTSEDADMETTTLNTALTYTHAMATQATSASQSVETSIAGLTAGGVSGPAVAKLSEAAEGFAMAAMAFQAAHDELQRHIAVQDAYNANAGAGDKAFVTGD